jgi:hypothetical protein
MPVLETLQWTAEPETSGRIHMRSSCTMVLSVAILGLGIELVPSDLPEIP